MNDLINDRALTHLRPAESRLAAVLSHPKAIAMACVVVLAALGWSACALLPADPAGGWQGTLCGTGRVSVSDFWLLATMWSAMALAMMLPTAGPMILTYAEIADTAARKSAAAVSPMVLAAGYVTVWLSFAVTAALLQLVFAALATPAAPTPAFGGAAFIAAGFYQFTSLKHACLTQCQRPFPFFFANWTTRPRGVFALGLRQGLFCLGCCWVMMLAMLVVGVMNAFWMAALGIVMTIEKLSSTSRFSRIVGAALIAAGAILIGMEFR